MFTVNQLTALEDAIVSGHKVVQYDGKRVEYQTVDELIKVRNLVRDDLIAQGLIAVSSTARGNTTVAEYGRDL